MLEAAGKGRACPQQELRVESIREMQRTVGLSPHSGRWKIFIIGDADKMNEEAANCLLKTLEEPPAHTILLLIAADESRLLPTIYSRCIHVPLRALSRKAISDALIEFWHADPEKAEQLAALSGGRLGWAVAMLERRGRMEQRSQALEDLVLLANANMLA